MTLAIRILAWCLAAAVAVATLGPVRYRPINYSLGQDASHALAFVLIGLAFGVAYRQNRWSTAAIAVALAGALELLQNWAPGRHARWEDFWIDALAALLGIIAAAIVDWLRKRLFASSRA